jgi:hypothetical protein
MNNQETAMNVTSPQTPAGSEGLPPEYAAIEHHVRTHRLEHTIAVAGIVAGLVVGIRDALQSLGRFVRGRRAKPSNGWHRAKAAR